MISGNRNFYGIDPFNNPYAVKRDASWPFDGSRMQGENLQNVEKRDESARKEAEADMPSEIWNQTHTIASTTNQGVEKTAIIGREKPAFAQGLSDELFTK